VVDRPGSGGATTWQAVPGMGWQSISLSASETRSQPSATNDEESPMPTYQYRCTECGTDLEAVQKFSDPALTECPTCHGSLRKVFNAVGVVFKGSGFYRTDSRPKEGASSTSGSGESKGKDAASSNGSEKKSSDAGAKSGSGDGAKSDGAKAPAKAASSSSGSSSTGSGSTS
jgi:putative FmdB family regulatory protein